MITAFQQQILKLEREINRLIIENNTMRSALEDKAMGRALRLIAEERARQDAKWGEQNHHGAVWSLIAGEEFGEVAQAQLELMFKGSQTSDPQPRQAYITELVQLAAVCQAWLECELRRDGDL